MNSHVNEKIVSSLKAFPTLITEMSFFVRVISRKKQFNKQVSLFLLNIYLPFMYGEISRSRKAFVTKPALVRFKP